MVTQEYSYKTPSLFKPASFINNLDKSNPLIILAMAINWPKIETFMPRFFKLDNGRPSLRIRLLVGLLMLKYYFNLSDDKVVAQWK
ncbi:MAG: transposase, partial [Deltaproteobacteria bacterium]|nr:transposase [Deltaproteobacteria bacterium]